MPLPSQACSDFFLRSAISECVDLDRRCVGTEPPAAIVAKPPIPLPGPVCSNTGPLCVRGLTEPVGP